MLGGLHREPQVLLKDRDLLLCVLANLLVLGVLGDILAFQDVFLVIADLREGEAAVERLALLLLQFLHHRLLHGH